ncbi:hypothetical protein [uncultured Pseudomonas sp.]|uniref:hypothetical protein n=1 Tax=uncultured Pseudomonas sp. TaxID=114707 RepID=UPI0025CF51E2|nr:hypothetical protein [uncultured Pseudomonas sp.]
MKTHKAPFAQSPRIQTAVVTAALASLATDSPTGTELLVPGATEGCIVTRVAVMPRGSVTVSSLVLFVKKSGQSAVRPIRSVLMPLHTMSTTTAIPETVFPNISDDAPLRLGAGDELYVGSQVAQAAGVVFEAEVMDY